MQIDGVVTKGIVIFPDFYKIKKKKDRLVAYMKVVSSDFLSSAAKKVNLDQGTATVTASTEAGIYTTISKNTRILFQRIINMFS